MHVNLQSGLQQNHRVVGNLERNTDEKSMQPQVWIHPHGSLGNYWHHCSFSDNKLSSLLNSA
jgi:hypothetical protein